MRRYVLRHHDGENHRVHENAEEIPFGANGDHVDDVACDERHDPDGRSFEYVNQRGINELPPISAEDLF